MITALAALALTSQPVIQASSVAIHLGDEVSFSVSGLAPGASVHLELWQQMFGQITHSSIERLASPDGELTTTDEPDRLFWSLKATDAPVPAELQPNSACLEAKIAGARVAVSCLPRVPLRAGVQWSMIRPEDEGFVGQLLIPSERVTDNVVVSLSGSEGGLASSAASAAVLANRGITGLAVAYFDAPGIPAALDRIPLEYFERVFAYVKTKLPFVPRRIIVMGPSRGSELALLLGSHYPEVGGVIAIVPGNAVWSANTESRTTSAWTWRGEEIPYMNSVGELERVIDPNGHVAYSNRRAFELGYAAVTPAERTTIPLENIHGPVLMLGAEDDQVWPSCDFGREAMNRLAAHARPYADAFHCFAGAGHDLGLPAWPTDERSFEHPSMGARLYFGGTSEAMGVADRQAWNLILDFASKNPQEAL